MLFAFVTELLNWHSYRESWFKEANGCRWERRVSLNSFKPLHFNSSHKTLKLQSHKLTAKAFWKTVPGTNSPLLSLLTQCYNVFESSIKYSYVAMCRFVSIWFVCRDLQVVQYDPFGHYHGHLDSNPFEDPVIPCCHQNHFKKRECRVCRYWSASHPRRIL